MFFGNLIFTPETFLNWTAFSYRMVLDYVTFNC